MILYVERCKLVTRTGTHVHESGQVWIMPCQLTERTQHAMLGTSIQQHAATTSVDTIKQTSNIIESRTTSTSIVGTLQPAHPSTADR